MDSADIHDLFYFMTLTQNELSGLADLLQILQVYFEGRILNLRFDHLWEKWTTLYIHSIILKILSGFCDKHK